MPQTNHVAGNCWSVKGDKRDREGVARIELARQARAGAIELRWSTTTRGVIVSECNGRILIQLGDALLAVPLPIAKVLAKRLETAARTPREGTSE